MTLLIIVYWPKITRKIPGSFVAIILTTLIVKTFHLPIETIALLAGIESLLSAVVADGMLGTRHRSNMELIAQGVANIASPIMGGIPATGAIARTATNIKNGGRTPFAGIIHALTLLLILIFFGPWASLIPMAALAGILISVAYNMSEWHLFLKIFKSPKSDVIVLLTTFLLTVFVDLTVAIKLGVVIAALLFMKRMSEATEVGCITDSLADQETDEEDFVDQNRISQKDIPEDVEVFEINGTRIILSGLQPRPFKKIKRAGLLKNTEDKNIQPTIDHAIDRAWQILKESKQNGIDD